MEQLLRPLACANAPEHLTLMSTSVKVGFSRMIVRQWDSHNLCFQCKSNEFGAIEVSGEPRQPSGIKVEVEDDDDIDLTCNENVPLSTL
jgi:hypothetical protein